MNAGYFNTSIYRRDDRPGYCRGSRVLAGIASMNTIAPITYRIWRAMSPKQRQRHYNTTAGKGNRRAGLQICELIFCSEEHRSMLGSAFALRDIRSH
ncbi:major facilitator superfamily transporter [Colletotrichum scovillei]|uniref:Major facilitator superfamily transporter n=1 Tax=Colletotrichum scovillei TaxID=1209932 RepID=A0A9P7RBF7_9PEZI|nr:major facilitator superfamily transporter [Colletotrichum scovillei]KAG7072709.1 major facilitator superfamily transporter [Colletotrichum scovillei]KAG7080973.1 major facilitator superfamily transporter [Colletotrichum scovillei]